ncbi:hypothetical protein MBLNU459_g7465t1 [Dothideomycetes sp. NU459]
MARLNAAAASTPAHHSSGAFMSHTPHAAHVSTPPSPLHTSPSSLSDKENQPASRPKDKGKGRMRPPAELPTPTSDDASGSHSAKRRRIESSRNGGADDGDEDEEDQSQKWYDPNQDPTIRQDIKRKSRALEREFNDNRDTYLRNNNDGLKKTISQANSLLEDVKQTSDATLDSRLMVSVSDLAYKKSAQLVLGDTSTGLDVDEFVSKCISFMRRDGRPPTAAAAPTATQARRSGRRNDDDDDDEEEDDNDPDVLDWAHLGSVACFPNNLRPPVPCFLLGPLSVQKRARIQTQRRARQQKDTTREVRPEALTKDDLDQNESNTLTVICSKIRERLVNHLREAESAIEAMGDLDDDEINVQMKRHRVSLDGGANLFDFVINPQSFGQTVENLFYVSFLIKEGVVGLSMDPDGMPTLQPSEPCGVNDQRGKESQRHQAVFSMDFSTWKKLIEAFDIKESLIDHRSEQQSTQVGSRGWYN